MPFTLPVRSEMFGTLTRDQRLRREVEDVLLGSWALRDLYAEPRLSRLEPRGLGLPDPLTSDLVVLRSALLPSLVDAVRHNLDAGARDVALFEMARVYLPVPGELPDERWHLAGSSPVGSLGRRGSSRRCSRASRRRRQLERATEPLLHPGKAARIESGWVARSIRRPWPGGARSSSTSPRSSSASPTR